MADGKKSFVLYCDMKHTVDLLDDALAGKLLKHLLRYVNDEDPEIDDLLLKIAFEPIKRQLKRDLGHWEETRVKRVESGHLGGIKSGQSRRKKQNQANEASALNPKQTEANEAVNVNGTVTVNDNVINKINNNGTNWEDIKIKWQGDFRWKEKVSRDKKIDVVAVEKKMTEFIAGIELKEDYKDIPGLKNHFINWYNKNQNGKSSNGTVGKTIEFDRP